MAAMSLRDGRAAVGAWAHDVGRPNADTATTPASSAVAPSASRPGADGSRAQNCSSVAPAAKAASAAMTGNG